MRNINYRAVLIEGPQIDDDGVVFRAERGGKLLAMGIALHEGRGQADTIRRAMRDLRKECWVHVALYNSII